MQVFKDADELKHAPDEIRDHLSAILGNETGSKIEEVAVWIRPTPTLKLVVLDHSVMILELGNRHLVRSPPRFSRRAGRHALDN